MALFPPGTVAKWVGLSLWLGACSTALFAKDLNTDYLVPPETRSEDLHYGVRVPVFHEESGMGEDDRTNAVVEMPSGRVIAIMPGLPAYNRTLNHHGMGGARWAADGSLLLWNVPGKWFPDMLQLVKIVNQHKKWQLDLLTTAQQAVLARTKKVAPKQYAAAKKENAGNGSAYPEGFSVDVRTANDEQTPVGLPLNIQVDLTANPKDDETPSILRAYLDAVVTEDGRFVVKAFHLGPRPVR